MTRAGTGKTYASAFAMRELGFKKVLFLVHRGQLARQTKAQVCTPFRVKLSEQNEIIGESMRDFASHQGYYKYEHLEFINSHIDNL